MTKFKRIVTAWSSPKEGSEAPKEDPWNNQNETTENSNWADFSTASFVAFSDKFDNQQETINIESDMKIENVEMKNTPELKEDEPKAKEVAAGDQAEGSVPSNFEKVAQL